jgi:uncharacterized membrane-anchored protein YhcB (DUF1043 family)
MTQEMLFELTFIRWLLIALVVIGLYFSYVFVSVMNGISNNQDTLNKQSKKKEKIDELEQLLSDKNALAAKFMAIEWLASQPNEPWAHWYLAKAYDQLGDYVETKKTLMHIQKTHPDWSGSIETWLEEIKEHLVPKGIK